MSYRATSVSCAIAASLALTYVSSAQASFERIHASHCFGAFDAFLTGTGYVDPWIDQGYTVDNDVSTFWGDVNAELMCPAPDSDRVSKDSWTTVNVEVAIGGSYGVSAAICEDQWNGYGGTCSTSRVASGGCCAHQTIALGGDVRSVWTSGDDNFGYITVIVGAGDELRGIYYSH